MTLTRNVDAENGIQNTSAPSYSHNADGSTKSWLFAMLGLIGSAALSSAPTFDSVGMTKFLTELGAGRAWGYAQKAPNAGSNTLAWAVSASDYLDAASIDYLDCEGPIQMVGATDVSIGTSHLTTKALRDTKATSKCLCFAVSRQYTIGEYSGDASLVTIYQSTHLEVAVSVFEKSGGGDVTFELGNPTASRDAAYLCIEVGETQPRSPLLRHAFNPLDYATGSSPSWQHASGERYLVSFLGHRDSSSPSGSQSFDGDALSLEDSASQTDTFAKLYSLEYPNAVLGTVSHPMSGSGYVDGVSLDFLSALGIKQSVSGVFAGGLHTADRTTSPLTNTNPRSLCYCWVVTRQNTLTEESGDTDLVTLWQLNTLEMATGLFQKDGNGGSVDFTIRASSYDRNACYISVEIEPAAGAGNRMILMMSEAWDRWRERASGLLVPRGFEEPVWRPKPQVLTPTARQVKALAA